MALITRGSAIAFITLGLVISFIPRRIISCLILSIMFFSQLSSCGASWQSPAGESFHAWRSVSTM
jgi:uncharacterized membrane protein